MKAPLFAHVRPRTLPEVLAAPGKHSEGARLLAGDRSLMAALNMRLSSPESLVALAGSDDLEGISVNRNSIRGTHVVIAVCLNRRTFAHRPC